jgi:hypothetical protein
VINTCGVVVNENGVCNNTIPCEFLATALILFIDGENCSSSISNINPLYI